MTFSHPILTLEDAKRFEEGLFCGDEAKEWQAMTKAGRAVGEAVVADFGEVGRFPNAPCVLVLAGKGHNGGDALLAAKAILENNLAACADIWLLFGERELRPLAARAYRELVHAAPGRVRLVSRYESLIESYDVALDGVFGFQFRPPLTTLLTEVFARLNSHPIRFRAAVDLPSGLGDGGVLRADFTYATGSVKAPAVDAANASAVGRLRYLDLGFFKKGSKGRADGPSSAEDNAEHCPYLVDRVLTPEVLTPFRCLRNPQSDKRTYCHVFIIGGSRSYPGAVLMSALAAARSGIGLITVFVPESLVAVCAARLPEAIWVGWPETPAGGLALEGLYLLRERMDRADALLLGPGVAREPETLALMVDIVKTATVPLVIDADALQPEVVRVGSAPRVLTPHAGEFSRIAGSVGLMNFSRETKAVTVLKGPLTRISDGLAVYHSCFGGPVLARGGSGDVLAGLIGGLLAQSPKEPLEAACRGVVWQGIAADLLARNQGQVAVQTTQILDYLAAALRNEGP
ncbi:MAG: NAD(P)H-hydrate dehydratase [Verrucomicrobia bacterium]|nr:NAD(P)H-hydrate dehydratase [Verrucomicrobiota bacterium]